MKADWFFLCILIETNLLINISICNLLFFGDSLYLSTILIIDKYFQFWKYCQREDFSVATLLTIRWSLTTLRDLNWWCKTQNLLNIMCSFQAFVSLLAVHFLYCLFHKCCYLNWTINQVWRKNKLFKLLKWIYSETFLHIYWKKDK